MCICSTALTCSLAAITLSSTFFLFPHAVYKGKSEYYRVIMIIMSYFVMYTRVASFMTFAVWSLSASSFGGCALS